MTSEAFKNALILCDVTMPPLILYLSPIHTSVIGGRKNATLKTFKLDEEKE